MKSISIRELHQQTGKFVREAAHQTIFVTDRGRQVAVLKAPSAAELKGRPFPRRRLSSMPKVRVDSKIYISEERDAR
jgi:antitoxin (DNA-binding transcriptional repressor) of toxin-antitoxin stability system